jgi:hypothetical protein
MKLLFLFMTAIISFAEAGVDVTATVDRNQVGIGDVINLTVSVSSDDTINVEEPGMPNLQGFELINTSSGVETRSTFQGGRFMTTQARTFNYMLAVLAPGTLTIPPLMVSVNGKAYSTKPIQIAVSNQRRGPPPQAQKQKQQADPFGMLDDAEEELFNQLLQRNFPGQARPGVPSGPPVNPDDAFFISAEVDKTSAYVGEQVTASFYLYTRGQIRDIDTLKYPDLKGFWKEEIEMATRFNFEQVVLNGVAYNRALLVSYALFPIHAGKATVDSYKAKCTVITAGNFGFGRPYQFTKASKPIAIDVREIPTQGRPENFTGAVGRFRVSAVFEPPTGTTNQPVTLRVRFDGQGNAKLVELPKLELPPSFELYDQKSQAKFLRDGTSYKEFEVLIIPRQPGVFQIPPLQVAVFDPATTKFANIASQPLSLTVTGQASAPQAPAQAGTTPNPESAKPGLPPLATELNASRVGAAPMMALTVAIYLAVSGFLAGTAWRRLRRKPKKLSLQLVLQRRLKNIRELAAQKEFRRVGVEMTNAAYYVIGQLSEAGGANLEMSGLLEKAAPSLRRELAQPIEKLLAQCEALSFAPESMIGEMTSKEKLQGLIAEFDRVLARAIELGDLQ